MNKIGILYRVCGLIAGLTIRSSSWRRSWVIGWQISVGRHYSWIFIKLINIFHDNAKAEQDQRHSSFTLNFAVSFVFHDLALRNEIFHGRRLSLLMFSYWWIESSTVPFLRPFRARENIFKPIFATIFRPLTFDENFLKTFCLVYKRKFQVF